MCVCVCVSKWGVAFGSKVSNFGFSDVLLLIVFRTQIQAPVVKMKKMYFSLFQKLQLVSIVNSIFLLIKQKEKFVIKI